MNAKIKKHSTNTQKLNTVFLGVAGAALLLRFILGAASTGFSSDIACFSGWAARVYEGGFSNFYAPEVFSDYPPGYIYVLYVIGALIQNLKLDAFTGLGLVLLKLPSIITDLAAGVLIYRVASKHFSEKSAMLLSALYLFFPAVLLDSVIWAQVDSILVFFVLLYCLFLQEGKSVPACFVFAAGLLFKPQMLVFAPLLLYGIYEHEILGFTTIGRFIKRFLGGVAAILCFFLGMVPFGIEKVIPQYTDTLASYPYVSVNAYNFWALFGLNWESQESTLMGISYQSIGTLCLVVLTVISAVIFELMRRRDFKERYVLAGAFLITTTFTFSVRMHERYLYPAMLLLLFSYIYSKRRGYLWSFLLVSAAHFLNVWHVLYHYDPGTYFENEGTVFLLSGIMCLCVAFFYVTVFNRLRGVKERPFSRNDIFKACRLPGAKAPSASAAAMKFTLLDFAIIAGICLVYGIVAFTNLGYSKAPETEYTLTTTLPVSLEFAPDQTPVKLYYYLKMQPKLTCNISQSMDDINWDNTMSIEMKDVYHWGEVSLSSGMPFFMCVPATEDGEIAEFIFLDESGEIVFPINREEYPALFDETDTIPEAFDYRANSYFDEIYYFRTATEFIEGTAAYENTHPPLGKIIIALGALLFGTNPFGFRFMGTLFGILMLPFMYLFGRDITRSRFIGGMACFIFAFDFMHFTQTRLATIDVYIVFFIIAMYFFMYRYIKLSFYDTDLKRTWLPLGACGIMFGLGVASKWTGLYAGAGLAIIFFATLYNRFREYQYACASPNGATNGISHKVIMERFLPNTKKTIAFCMIFFVAIPMAIYTLSYIPFRDYINDGLISTMLRNQKTMFDYHSNLTATHGYASSWYEWPTMVRPVFYYSKILGNDMYQGISAFGNPAVWYTALPAVCYTFYMAVRKKRTAALFLSVGILAQFLPWLLVTRCTFLYHYFPSVPFLVLMLCYTASDLKKKLPPKVFYTICIIYCLLVLGLFIMFYPVISGAPVSGSYVVDFLRWRDSWVLVYNY